MLNKFLLIGVGGTGGKTLRYTWHELERRLSAQGWHHGIPDAWQFLHIDVPELTDVVEADVPATVGAAVHYLGLARDPHRFPHYDTGLVTRGPLSAYLPWRPDPKVSLRPPFKGAGQRRVVGRVVALHELDAIGHAIDDAVRRLTSPTVDAQLAQVNHTLKATSPVNAGKATVVVISSLGGGSGSGIYLDVIELLKRKATGPHTWLDDNLITLLFSADTFAHLKDNEKQGVEPNSLAALSEFMAAFDHTGSPPDDEDALMARGGGAKPIDGSRASMLNLLVGAENGTITFENGHDAYRAVGKSFAAFMANDAVQVEFHTYLPNAGGAPCRSSFIVAPPSASFRHFSSLGYANVSLGREIFADYAEERLAKLAIERLLHGHREGVADVHLRSNDALIDEAVKRAKSDFFEASGLWELNEDHNQVLDALRDIPAKRAKLDQLRNDTLAGLSAKRKAKGQEWFRTVEARFNDAAREFENAEAAERSERAQKWVPAVQAKLVDATAKSAGAYGIPVTVRLLRDLDTQVKDASQQLVQAAADYEEEQGTLLDGVRSLFGGLWDQAFGASHETLGEAAKRRRRALQRGTEAALYRFTAELLSETRTGLIAPLIAALERAQETLDKGERDTHRAAVAQWSTYAFPNHLRAAKNEGLLEPEDKFPEQLDALLQGAFEGFGTGGAEKLAVAEVISGMWKSIYADGGHRGEQTLVGVDQRWWPTRSEARPPSHGPSTAAYVIDCDVPQVLQWARQWVQERSPVAEYVGETLAAWLDPNHKDSADRAARFASAIKNAIGHSAPLVTINTEAYAAAHSDDLPDPRLVLSDIPIGQRHAAYQAVSAALTNAGQQQARFDPTSTAQQVEFSSFLGWTVHPVALSSLMTPLQQDWLRESSDAGTRETFWSYRRARNLRSFTPLSPAQQQALTRGWLTAERLGHVDKLSGRWSEKPLSIWTPDGRRRFPRQLLGVDPVEHASVLPALMESMILSYIAFANSDPEPLEAYMRLIKLGTAGGVSPGHGERYSSVNAELLQWINDGTPTETADGTDNAPIPDETRAGTNAQTPEERRDALVKSISSYGDRLTSGADKLKLNSKQIGKNVPRTWQIRELLEGAVADLVSALKIVQPTDDDENVIGA